jgi:transcriptional regulator with XRE-family HTH domain
LLGILIELTSLDPMPKPTAIAVFAARLKQARLALGVSQAVLGVRMGLPPEVASTRLNRYEKGVHIPNLDTAKLMAEQLGVPVAYLLADNDRLANAILGFSNLSVADQDHILAAIQKAATGKGRAKTPVVPKQATTRKKAT